MQLVALRHAERLAYGYDFSGQMQLRGFVAVTDRTKFPGLRKPISFTLDHRVGISGPNADMAKSTRVTSRPRDFHPRALPEPYVNLSIHTAPDVRPLPWHSGQ
jgi:hypothetical protein